MLNVWLAGDHLYGKLLFTWLSLVMYMMVSFLCCPFPTRCLGWDLDLNLVSFWGFFYLLFNVQPIARSYGDGTSVLSLIRKTGELGNRSRDPWIGSLACYPLHYRRSYAFWNKVCWWMYNSLRIYQHLRPTMEMVWFCKQRWAFRPFIEMSTWM